MNQRLSNRLLELENTRAIKDKPIMYLWIEPGDDPGDRIAKAALDYPDKQIISIGWLSA